VEMGSTKRYLKGAGSAQERERRRHDVTIPYKRINYLWLERIER